MIIEELIMPDYVYVMNCVLNQKIHVNTTFNLSKNLSHVSVPMFTVPRVCDVVSGCLFAILKLNLTNQRFCWCQNDVT